MAAMEILTLFAVPAKEPEAPGLPDVAAGVLPLSSFQKD